MFRFIAIAWDASQARARATSDHLCQASRAKPDWQPALLRSGLEVFTIGSRAGINEAVPLHGGLGVIVGKLFRRRDLGTQAPSQTALSAADSAAILDTGGQTLVDDFWGRYVAFFQTACGSVRVLRDPTGALPCFRIHHEGVAIVFSWLEDALSILETLRPWAVQWDAFGSFLLGGKLGGRQTALVGVLQVLPGESIDLHSQASVLLWNAMDVARAPRQCGADEAVQAIRRTVLDCTAAWASCHDRILVRLSGGVDSSILMSCLTPDRTAADVVGINYYSAGSDSDERSYARMTAARVGRDLIERQRDLSFHLSQVFTSARTCEPVRYTGAFNGATDASLASAYDAPAMFTGGGGDSVFFEYSRWWPAADYLVIRGLDAGFASVAMDAARLGKVSIWRTIALAFKERTKASSLMPELIGPTPLLAEDLRRCVDDRPHFIHPALRDADDVPIGKRMQTMSAIQPATYYSPFEREAAPELVNPLLSQPLLELCLSLPTYLLTQGGHGRALARRAFAQDLPPQIVNRRSKGGLAEHVRAVLTANIDEIRGLLLDGHLAKHGQLDRTNVEEALSGRPTTLAGHASQIHALVAAEAWLQRWVA